MQNFTRIMLNRSNRCEAVESSKSFALKWRNRICFLPTEYCKIYDSEIKGIKWIIDIPVWLIEKNETIKEFVELITEENEDRNR